MEKQRGRCKSFRSKYDNRDWIALWVRSDGVDHGPLRCAGILVDSGLDSPGQRVSRVASI